MSRQFEEKQEENRDRKIAEQLGITYDELCETSFTIEPQDGNDGVIYGYYIRFDQNSSNEVLTKIDGLKNFCIDIDLNDADEFNSDDFDHYENGSELLADHEKNIGDQLLPYLAEQAKRKRDEENK